MNEINAPYTNTPDPAELSFEARKKRDEDVSLALQFKSNEEIILICREAMEAEQRKKLLADLCVRNTISWEKLLQTKLFNRK